jgi:hypothetical protein
VEGLESQSSPGVQGVRARMEHHRIALMCVYIALPVPLVLSEVWVREGSFKRDS